MWLHGTTKTYSLIATITLLHIEYFIYLKGHFSPKCISMFQNILIGPKCRKNISLKLLNVSHFSHFKFKYDEFRAMCGFQRVISLSSWGRTQMR